MIRRAPKLQCSGGIDRMGRLYESDWTMVAVGLRDKISTSIHRSMRPIRSERNRILAELGRREEAERWATFALVVEIRHHLDDNTRNHLTARARQHQGVTELVVLGLFEEAWQVYKAHASDSDPLSRIAWPWPPSDQEWCWPYIIWTLTTQRSDPALAEAIRGLHLHSPSHSPFREGLIAIAVDRLDGSAARAAAIDMLFYVPDDDEQVWDTLIAVAQDIDDPCRHMAIEVLRDQAWTNDDALVTVVAIARDLHDPARSLAVDGLKWRADRSAGLSALLDIAGSHLDPLRPLAIESLRFAASYYGDDVAADERVARILSEEIEHS